MIAGMIGSIGMLCYLREVSIALELPPLFRLCNAVSVRDGSVAGLALCLLNFDEVRAEPQNRVCTPKSTSLRDPSRCRRSARSDTFGPIRYSAPPPSTKLELVVLEGIAGIMPP